VRRRLNCEDVRERPPDDPNLRTRRDLFPESTATVEALLPVAV